MPKAISTPQSQIEMQRRFERALTAMDTSKPEAHAWRLFEVFKPLPRPAAVALSVWAAERALLVFEEESPRDDRARQAVEKIRGWQWGRVRLPEIFKTGAMTDSMKYAYSSQEASSQACESIHFAAAVIYAEFYWTPLSQTFSRSVNANVALRAGMVSGPRAVEATEEEQQLQRDVTRGFLSSLLRDESALVLLDECRGGDEQARAIWMDRLTDIGVLS